MSDTVIRVENLSKKYVISHQEQEKYTTLRDAIANRARSLTRKIQSPPFGKSISKSAYEDFWALKDVSFEIKQGDSVGVIGRNGAGKSTLLKILSRITEPTTGCISIKGRVASLLEVGTGFHPELTGRENIYLNGAILGMSRVEIKKKFEEIVAFAEIEKFLDTPVKRYSSGMYVRLAFAVAAHLEPEILIVDEVLAVGDAQFQKKCLTKMGDVAQEGRTVLFVSHNMGAVRSLCDWGIWLKSGEITLSGPIISVTDSYFKSMLRTTDLTVDLRTAKRSYSTAEDLQLINLEFNSGKPILHGEPLTVRIEYKTFKEVHGVAFAIGFSSLEGIRLMSLDSDILNARWDLAGYLHGTIEMRLDELLLQPGRYLIDVGARTGGEVALDYIPACLQVEILPGPKTPGHIIRSDGGVRMPAQWKWMSSVIHQ